MRGLCALSVMAYHLLYWQDLATLSTLGTYGVYLFFILSGASLAYVYDTQALGTLRGAGAFLAARWLRLAPLYIVVCALFLIMLAAAHGRRLEVSGLWVLLNLSFLFGAFTPSLSSLAIGGWSLGIEFMFYLALPLLVRALPHRLWATMLLVALVVLQWVWIDRTVGTLGLEASTYSYHQVPAFAAYFFAGCLIGHARRSSALDLSGRWGLAIWVTIAVLLLALAPDVSGDELIGARGVVLPLACIAAVWASGQIVVAPRLRPLAQWLGDVTYGTYLLHPLLFFGFTWFVLPEWTHEPIEALPVTARCALLVVAVTLSCLLAAASERVFERPVRTAGRRLLARWMPPRGA
jgi:peptidoglycan/LPS O-acetylase OafA/YrhL